MQDDLRFERESVSLMLPLGITIGRYGNIVPGPAYDRKGAQCRGYSHSVTISGQLARLCRKGILFVRMTWMMSVCVINDSTNQPV